jgi:hypothetical protein
VDWQAKESPMAKKKKPPKTWMLTPPRQKAPQAPLSERVKANLDARSLSENSLLLSFLPVSQVRLKLGMGSSNPIPDFGAQR